MPRFHIFQVTICFNASYFSFLFVSLRTFRTKLKIGQWWQNPFHIISLGASESIWTQELVFVDVVSDVKLPGEPSICILHRFGKDALFSTFS